MKTQTEKERLNNISKFLNKKLNPLLNEIMQEEIGFKNSFYYYSDTKTKNKYFYTTSKKFKNKDSKRKGYISGVYVYLKSKKIFKARYKKSHAKKKDAIKRALELSKEFLKK